MVGASVVDCRIMLVVGVVVAYYLSFELLDFRLLFVFINVCGGFGTSLICSVWLLG